MPGSLTLGHSSFIKRYNELRILEEQLLLDEEWVKVDQPKMCECEEIEEPKVCECDE